MTEEKIEEGVGEAHVNFSAVIAKIKVVKTDKDGVVLEEKVVELKDGDD